MLQWGVRHLVFRLTKKDLIQNMGLHACHVLRVSVSEIPAGQGLPLCMSLIFITQTSETRQLFCCKGVIVLSPWERGLAQTCPLAPQHRCLVKE